MRLNKFIAANTEFSRRKADELIESGQVTINGKTATLGTDVDPANDNIQIQGTRTSSKTEKIYLVLNKPGGYVVTRKDELDRKTVMELVPQNQNLKPVGRLDLDTEGLLLFSNDGDFINTYLHPSFELEKEYEAKISGRFTEKEKRLLEKGLIIDAYQTAPAKIQVIHQRNDETMLRIVIHEGRNRQIRKMFAQVRCTVKYLQRIRIGKIKLGALKLGDYRPLTIEELNVK